MAREEFGTVQPLAHLGCSVFCRDLCFAVRDPRSILVRLTHEVWFATLAKENRSGMAGRLELVEAVVATPWQIHADKGDPRALLYYSEPSGPNDRLLCVAVKCLPHRVGGRGRQLVYTVAGRIARREWGEAWVSSAYPVKQFRARGYRVWP